MLKELGIAYIFFIDNDVRHVLAPVSYPAITELNYFMNSLSPRASSIIAGKEKCNLVLEYLPRFWDNCDNRITLLVSRGQWSVPMSFQDLTIANVGSGSDTLWRSFAGRELLGERVEVFHTFSTRLLLAQRRFE